MKRNKIKVESEIIRIIDPRFNKGWWGHDLLNNCQKGTWNFKIKKKRNGYPENILLYHNKYKMNKKKIFVYKNSSLRLITNKIAIFDEKYYQKWDNIIFDKCYLLYSNGVILYLSTNETTMCIQKNKKDKVVVIKIYFGEDEI